MESGWINPQSGLMDLYRLSHNINGLVSSLNNNIYISQEKIQDITQLVGKSARKKDFTGPHLFIRAEYKGVLRQDKNGWIDASNILALNEETRDISEMDITRYVDEVVEHCLGYFSEFGEIHTIHTVSLPKGESILGIVKDSRLSKINPLLARSSERIYFPIIHPEWLQEFPQY